MDLINAKLNRIIDSGSFKELWPGLMSYNFLKFPDYSQKLDIAREKTGLKDTIVTGICSIMSQRCVLIAFEPSFLMGTMGLVAGEKITRSFQLATKYKLPVITLSSSGGVRLQEGIISLIQMVNTSAAVYAHSMKHLLFISVICEPTLGGVTASFASLADIIIGEKGSHFGFSGQRIIEETTHEKLPAGFQTVEYCLKCGMVDMIVMGSELRETLGRILTLHSQKGRYNGRKYKKGY